jgi:hypothetical protein
MKFFYFAFVSSLLGLNVSLAAIVQKAKLDENKENILILVSYSGGCKEHHFSLKVKNCVQTRPVKCDFQLVDVTFPL